MIGFDTRNFTQPLFIVKAHDKSASAASFSPHHSGMMATVGTDSVCKVWDVQACNPEGVVEPKLVSKRDLK